MRQQVGKSLAMDWPAPQAAGVELLSYRENRRRMAGDAVEARDCAARTLRDGTVGIVRYAVLRQAEGDGFRVDVSGQEAQQEASR